MGGGQFRGFTLIELLGVVVVLGVLALIAFPSILKQINNAKNGISEATKMLIIDAAKDYYEDNKNDFKKVDEVSYCISVSDLVKYNYLNSKLKDKDLNDINTSKQVKMNYINNSFKYEIVDACNYYTVTFDTDGGDIDIESKQVLEGSLYGELPVPTKEGYTFMGWRNSNLLNYNNLLDAAINYDIVVDENGYVKNSKSLADPRTWNFDSSNWKLKLYPGTYVLTLDFVRQSTNREVARIMIINKNQESLLFSDDIVFKDKKSFVFDILETQDIGIIIKSIEGIYRIKLEKGNESTEWVPYQILTSMSKIIRDENHTLYAEWKENN